MGRETPGYCFSVGRVDFPPEHVAGDERDGHRGPD